METTCYQVLPEGTQRPHYIDFNSETDSTALCVSLQVHLSERDDVNLSSFHCSVPVFIKRIS
jgi:hypothetical protein